MIPALGEGQLTRGTARPVEPSRVRGEIRGIDTHCLGHLGIQPAVIQVLSDPN